MFGNAPKLRATEALSQPASALAGWPSLRELGAPGISLCLQTIILFVEEKCKEIRESAKRSLPKAMIFLRFLLFHRYAGEFADEVVEGGNLLVLEIGAALVKDAHIDVG